MNNILFLDKSNYSATINVNDNDKKELYIIDTINDNVYAKIEVFIKSNANVDIIISSFNKSKNNKKFNIIVHHLNDNSTSTCQVFGVNKDNAITTFDLEAIIKDSSKGNYCEQSIKGILLSNGAKIEGKPNLIINTNNIKAKHALAIGKLNPAHIFYLQSKGITRLESIKLILMSYFNVIVSKINDDNEREKIINKIYKDIGNIEK